MLIALLVATKVLGGGSAPKPDDGGGIKSYRFVPELKRILNERAARKEALDPIKGTKGKQARYMVRIAAKEAEKAVYSDGRESEQRLSEIFDKWMAVYRQSLVTVPLDAAFQTFMAQVIARMEQDEEDAIILMLADG